MQWTDLLKHFTTRARTHTPVRFAFKFAPTYRWVLDSSTKISPQRKKFCTPSPAHIIDPPTTTACNMSDTYSETEKRIKRALDEMRALESAPVIADFARQYDVPYNRLYRRFHGTPSKSDRVSGNRRFLDVEEKAICRYLDRLDKLSLPAQRELLRGAADNILLANWTPASPDEKPPSVGQHWASRFLERHPEYTLKRQKVLDLERERAESYESLKNWFQLLQDVITDHGIDSNDIWNFDETGFRIGVGRDQLVITKQQRQLYLGHPTNRESVTAIEAVSAGGAHIPLFLIFSGITHQSSNSELGLGATVAVSHSGYSSNQLSLDWLHHFEKHSRKLTKGTKRLLLLDGYRSHHTIEFIQYCDNNGIIPFGFPPNTTHILQPLDVVMFQPYKHYHTKALDVAVRDGCTRFNKVEFLSAIDEIRRQTFKESTIKSAFRKTGIVPFKPSTVLSQFQSPAESEPTTPSRSSTGRHNPDVLKTTPLTIRSLKRQSEFLYENAPQDNPEFTEVLDKFIRGSILQSTELLQSMRDLSRTRLTEKIRSERAMNSRRSLQSGGTLTVEEGRHMVRQLDDERAKAERLLEEKDSKMRKKWVGAAAKIARAWRREGKLRPFYIVDAYGKGRELVRS
jgi:hypothetical protein